MLTGDIQIGADVSLLMDAAQVRSVRRSLTPTQQSRDVTVKGVCSSPGLVCHRQGDSQYQAWWGTCIVIPVRAGLDGLIYPSLL